MGVLARAELLLQAKNYSGSGAWLDEANSHDAQFGSLAGADTNDPLFLAHTGIQHAYFPGGAGNSVSVVLAAATIYDYTVTYLDDTTATGSETSDGGGVLILGEDQANFSGNKLKTIDVTADGGGATLALFDATDIVGLVEPFASYTDTIPETWTLNRAASGRVSTIVDRPMFLLGTDDYFEIPDDGFADFAQGEDFSLLVAFRDPIAIDNKVLFATGVGGGTRLSMLTRNVGNSVRMWVEDDAGVSIDDLAGTKIKGIAHVAGAVRNTTDDDFEVFLDGTGSGSPAADTTTGDIDSGLEPRIGRYSGGSTAYWNGEIHAVVLWREALTDAEVVLAGEELLAEAVPVITRRSIRSPRYGITRMASR